MTQREEYQLLAGYWMTVAETAEGYPLEQANMYVNHFIRLLGQMALYGE